MKQKTVSEKILMILEAIYLVYAVLMLAVCDTPSIEQAILAGVIILLVSKR